MKAKLIKVHVGTHTVFFNYGDDQTDVNRHIVSETSPWEEVDDNKFMQLQAFVNQQNVYCTTHLESYYYVLVTDDQPFTCSKAIEQMEREAAEITENYRQAELKRQKDALKKKEENATKRKEKLKRQLEKLTKELAEANKST